MGIVPPNLIPPRTQRNIFPELALKFQAIRQISRHKGLHWRIGREGNTLFVMPPDSFSWWLYIGTIDEILAFSVSQLDVHLRFLYRFRPLIWSPSDEWHNGIGESEIERYHGRELHMEHLKEVKE